MISAIEKNITGPIQAARAASAILEWIEIAGADCAADLAMSSFGATISHGPHETRLELLGLEVEAEGGTGRALTEWAHEAIRGLSLTARATPLSQFMEAYGQMPRDKFHDIVLKAARIGLGSYMSPSDNAQREASNLFEILMFGTLGRGTSSAEAVENWRDAAFANTSGAADFTAMGNAA